MEKIKNLSVRKTIVLYMAVCIFLTYLTAYAFTKNVGAFQERIWEKYTDREILFQEEERLRERGVDAFVAVPRPEQEEMSKKDAALSEACDALITWSWPVLSLLGSVGVVFLFYRTKLKGPLRELSKGSKRISENDLDFQMEYESRDELGELCREFEKMRGELARNQRELWKRIEEEKALKEAIAHDIRSPLAVLKGYQEMLLELVPQGGLDPEREREILEAGLGQILRLEDFVETMRKLSSVEEREIQKREILAQELAQELERTLEAESKRTGKGYRLSRKFQKERFLGDQYLIQEVADNLLANAFRYARYRVLVTLEIRERELVLTVQDDGKGFEKDTDTVTKPYYRGNPQDDLKHFGLGLYLCRVYCEKHGGGLYTGNRESSGGEAEAVFRC